PDQKLLNSILPNQAPRTQNLLSYEANIYRDWVWGEHENNQSLEIIVSLLGDKKVEHLFVPGCGAGRLLYDLANSLNPTIAIGSDINPLLLMIAKAMLNNQSVNLVEFPSAAKDLQSVAVEQTLKPVDAPSNIHLVFSDLLKTPFAHGAFDCVVTPWLIDILPSRLEVTLQALNQYLPVGGMWINFGSLVFNQSDVALHYTLEEIVELVKLFGFEIEEYKQQEIDYLNSPHNAGHRMEVVTAWRAVKTHDIEAPNTTQHLPDWLLDSKAPVPAMQEFAQFAQQQSVAGEIMSWANGQLSLSKMANRFSKKYKVDKVAAESSILQLYRQVYEESLMRRYNL
ncbi:MAG: hypothetical protein V2I33_06700, partial [Kangiellaceae bacterium]|nr:hypothetical protein [Kangiellaceae bacterium]